MDSRILEEIVNIFRRGGVALLPTETVYGLMCDWYNENARNKIYNLKRRDKKKPFQMLISDLSVIEEKCRLKIPGTARMIADSFCPGPITIICETENMLSLKTEKIGFRIPNHKLMLEILNEYGMPLASTSANLTGQPPALCVEDALNQLNGEPDFVWDTGPLPIHSIASTVIEVAEKDFKVLREGPICINEIYNLLKVVKR